MNIKNLSLYILEEGIVKKIMSNKLFNKYLPNNVFNDLFDPSARAIGQGIGGLFDKIFYPLIKTRIVKHDQIRKFSHRIGKNIYNIPKKYRDPSKLYIATKIMESSKYCVNENVLQTCFAYLLSNSIDSRKNNLISSYFPTVLSNMDVKDAVFLSKYKEFHQERYPIGIIKIVEKKNPNLGYNLDKKLIVWNWDDNDKNIVSFQEDQINLLKSLSILSVSYRSKLAGSSALRAYKDMKLIAKNKVKLDSKDQIELGEGVISLTSIGEKFVKMAIPSNKYK